jgi:hypothetical protein
LGGAGICPRHHVCAVNVFTSLGEIEMDFQVNDQTYFLSLAEDEKRWLFFVSTPEGALSIPVYEDAAESRPLVVLQEEKHRVPN